MKTKDFTDKQIQEQINELEEENANTKRLSTKRGYGWGDSVLEKRRDKINHLLSILAMRKFDKKKATPKKQGLTMTWNSKTKRWVYKYTKRTKKAKKQPDTKLSQREEWLLTGEYKIRDKPKEVRKLGKAVTKGVKKTKKATKAKVKPKKKMRRYKGTEIRAFYVGGQIPYEVDVAIKKHDNWAELKINPEKIDTNINEFSFAGKPEKPRFDRVVKDIMAGKSVTPILVEKTISHKKAKQVLGAFFDSPIDGFARVAAHKKTGKPIRILIPEEVYNQDIKKKTKKPKPKKKKRTKAKAQQRTLFGG